MMNWLRRLLALKKAVRPPSPVRLELEAVRGGGTRLLLKHWAIGELSPTAQEGFARGWRGLLDDKLRAYVERGRSLGVRAR